MLRIAQSIHISIASPRISSPSVCALNFVKNDVTYAKITPNMGQTYVRATSFAETDDIVLNKMHFFFYSY